MSKQNGKKWPSQDVNLTTQKSSNRTTILMESLVNTGNKRLVESANDKLWVQAYPYIRLAASTAPSGVDKEDLEKFQVNSGSSTTKLYQKLTTLILLFKSAWKPHKQGEMIFE